MGSGLPYSENKVEAFQALLLPISGEAGTRGETHPVSFTNVATDSLYLDENTTMVELFATQDCWVLLKADDDTTAAAIPANMTKTKARFIASDITHFFGIDRVEGVNYRFSVIRNATNGELRIAEGR